ncbi:hypothetical protein M422DRAFT_778461 [Sphaerobolus stellatus SS14]|nr:hypothetical protein M422DRAFT_778461 [Sphaerobolus stellatus SS14]
MHRLFHLTLVFVLLSLSLTIAPTSASIDAHHVSRGRHRMIKKRADNPTTGSGLLGNSGLGVANAVPDPIVATPSVPAAATGADQTAPADTKSTSTPAAAGADGASTTDKATSTTSTPAAGVGGIISSAVAGLTSQSTKTTSTSSTSTTSTTSTSSTSSTTSSTSTTSTTHTTASASTTPSTAPSSPPSTTPLASSTSLFTNAAGGTVTSVVFASTTPSSTQESDNNKKTGGVTTVGKRTIIILAAIGGSIGAAAIIWTLIRKWKFGRSSSFDERLQPIDWQPTNDNIAPAGERGFDRDFSERSHLERNGSTRSHGSFTSGNGHPAGSQDHLTADIPPHDFTAPAPQSHLAPVGGYADLQRGPSPQPNDYYRSASPYQGYEAQQPAYQAAYDPNAAAMPNPYQQQVQPQMQQYYGGVSGAGAGVYPGYEHRGY